MHVTSLAKQLTDDYLVRAESACKDHASFLPLLEHFLLTSGLVLRDVHSAFFSLHDPDDAEPLTMPEYVQRTQLDLAYAVRVENAVKIVLDELSMLLSTNSQSSSSPSHPTIPQGEEALTDVGGPQHPILPWSANLGLESTENHHQHKKEKKSKRPHSPERPDLGSHPGDGKEEGGKPKKRRKPVPSKPREDAFSRSFDPAPLLANATPGKRSKRPLSPDTAPARIGDSAAPAPAPRKRHKQMPAGSVEDAVTHVDAVVRTSGRLRGKERVVYTKNGIAGKE